MKIIKNEIGWEDEYGNQLALNEKWAILNCCRKEEFKTPVWKELKGEDGELQ